MQGSTGALVVKGPNSLWTDTAGLQVGGDGVGSFTVLNQGEAKSSYATIGTSSTSTGTATVDGAGSKWTVANELVVGDFGKGTLAIINGGKVSNAAALIGRMAHGATGTGDCGRRGFQLDQQLCQRIGDEGSGSLAITNGGVAGTLAGGIAVAGAAGSTGHVNAWQGRVRH